MNVIVTNNKTKKHDNKLLPALTVVKSLIDEGFLSVYGFADIAGYHHSYVRQLIIKGKLKSYKVGRRRLIAVIDAVEFANKKKSADFLKKKAMIVNSKGKLTGRKKNK